MKKILIALSMMVIPLTAHAQSGGEKVVQDAADELKPAFCANDLKQAIQIVEGCYTKVDEDSKKYNMNQCVAEDIFVMSIISEKRKKYLNNLQTDPYANSTFANNTSIALRWSKHPNFVSNITDSNDAKNIGYRITKDIINALKPEGCLNLDKLK